MVNVVGLYKTAAEEQMKKNGFTNYTFVEKTDATVEKGYVISQSIDDGTSITKDTQITIYVSSGKERPRCRMFSDMRTVRPQHCSRRQDLR